MVDIKSNKIAFAAIAFVVNLLFIITASYATFYTNYNKSENPTPEKKAGHSFAIAMLTISCVTMVALIVFTVLTVKNKKLGD
jgi:heme/copper-type cytochrome/quinol oxidase subunit 2